MARKKYTPQKATLREMVSNYLKENNDARIKIVQNKRDHLNLLFHAILKKRRRKGVWPCQRGQDILNSLKNMLSAIKKNIRS